MKFLEYPQARNSCFSISHILRYQDPIPIDKFILADFKTNGTKTDKTEQSINS